LPIAKNADEPSVGRAGSNSVTLERRAISPAALTEWHARLPPRRLPTPHHSPTARDASSANPIARSGGSALERMAAASLILLALTFGLGDIAQVTPLDALVLNAVHSLLLLVLGLTLLSALRQHRLPSFPRPLALPTSAWLAILLISATLADSHRSDAIASLERPACGALLAWAVYDLCGTTPRWQRLLHALALGGLAVALIALAEASGAPIVLNWLTGLQEGAVPIGDVPRVAATLSHPNEAAMLLELSLPLLVAWAWTASPAWRLPLVGATLSTLLAIVQTFSRAGIVAALIAMGVLGAITVSHHERRRLVPLGVAALIVPLGLAWAALADPGLDRRLTAGIDESSALQPARTEFWSVAIGMLRDHPWFGVGPDNYRWQFMAYSGVDADNLGIHAHNQYLETLADTGVLGLITFAWLLIALLRVALRRLRDASAEWHWRAALLASLTAWLVHALLDDFERFWPTSAAFWLITGLTLCQPRLTTRFTDGLNALAAEEPVHQPNDRDHHQQHQNPRWAAERPSAATSAKAHHSADIVLRRGAELQE
jgi:O-antigen ligase